MSNSVVKNFFNVNTEEYILLKHVLRHIDEVGEVISIIEEHQHGLPANIPIVGVGDPNCIYIVKSLNVFTDDPETQILYTIVDQGGNAYDIVATQTFAQAGAKYETRINQHDFIIRNISQHVNITYMDFTGWKLTLKI